MAGVFNRPFGHEIGYSTSGLESPERATIIQYFFPDERDLGAMLTLRTKKRKSSRFPPSGCRSVCRKQYQPRNR